MLPVLLLKENEVYSKHPVLSLPPFPHIICLMNKHRLDQPRTKKQNVICKKQIIKPRLLQLNAVEDFREGKRYSQLYVSQLNII